VITSSPDKCPSGHVASDAYCLYQPTQAEGSENLAFSVTLTSTGTYSFAATAVIRFYSTYYCSASNSYLCTPAYELSNPFSVHVVVTATTQTYTTPIIPTTLVTSSSPASSLQIPQPPQPTISSLAFVLAVITAIVLVLYTKRTEPPKLTKARKVRSTTKKSGKNFVERGSELPLK